MLKLNNDKTELITFIPHKTSSDINKKLTISVSGSETPPTSQVKNLGVILDPKITLQKQINNVSKTSHHYLRHISRIRKYLTKAASQSLVQSLVMSRLDYCNALYQGLPKTRISVLQRVQNSAARLITRTPRRQHITPVLKSLHWLPISRRCQFKTLSYVYKASQEQAPSYIEDML